ncbi:MAG: outer membrane beta-barrel protein [Culturomica sp.]|jgi:hypothetical protein|nr:outer membrane beta-barrel protein [Culturomica sp.]
MKKLLLSVLFIVFCVGLSFSQSISGKVTDEKNEAIPYANIIISSLPDSTYAVGGVTKDDGTFNLNVENADGDFLLSVSFIGYNDVAKTCKVGDAGTIILKENQEVLDEVVVMGKRIEHKANGYSINLKNDKIGEGKQAPELLSFLPGVNLDENNAIKILSKSPYAIYLNNVEISENELKAIPASQIESVDVDYMAGMKESANAKGGIIRIKLKKEIDGGYSGHLRGSVSDNFYSGYNGGAVDNSFSARYGKLSIYNSILYDRSKLYSDYQNDHFFKDRHEYIYSYEEYRNWSNSFYDRLNLTYDISDKHSLGVSGLYYTNKQKPHTNTSYEKQDTEQSSSLYSPNRNDMYQAVLNYTWDMNKEGRKLDFTADYLRNNVKLDQEQTSTEISEEETSHTSQHTDMFRMKPVFTTPLAKGELSIGGDMQYIRYRDELTNAMEPQGRNTKMDGYQPALFAGYSGAASEKLYYELGLRFQGSIMDVKTEGVNNNNEDWGLCPTVSLMYMINPEKGHLVNLQYNRSLEYLPYSVISTYKNYSSPQSYTVGNPNLTPPTNNTVTAILNLFNQLTLSAYYSYDSNPIYYATEVDAENSDVSYTIPRNGKSQSFTLFSLEWRTNPFKWWQAKASAYYRLQSLNTGIYNYNNQSSYTLSLNNNFKFSGFGGTLNMLYDPAMTYLNESWKYVFNVSGSAYKTLVKKKLELRANFTLYRHERTITTDTPVYTLRANNQTKSEYAKLSLIWFFNGGKNVQAKEGAQSIQEYQVYEKIGN